MSDTPRTDAEIINIHDEHKMVINNEHPCVPLVTADFARQLERELAEAKEQLREAVEFCVKWRQVIDWCPECNDTPHHHGCRLKAFLDKTEELSK